MGIGGGQAAVAPMVALTISRRWLLLRQAADVSTPANRRGDSAAAARRSMGAIFLGSAPLDYADRYVIILGRAGTRGDGADSFHSLKLAGQVAKFLPYADNLQP